MTSYEVGDVVVFKRKQGEAPRIGTIKSLPGNGVLSSFFRIKIHNYTHYDSINQCHVFYDEKDFVLATEVAKALYL